MIGLNLTLLRIVKFLLFILFMDFDLFKQVDLIKNPILSLLFACKEHFSIQEKYLRFVIMFVVVFELQSFVFQVFLIKFLYLLLVE